MAGAVFSDLTKKSRIAFSLAGARLFAFLARSGCFFLGAFFLSCLWRCFLSLGGGFGGVGVGGGGWGWA